MRLISSDLPDTEASEEGIPEAHEIIKETHQEMGRRYRAVANRTRKNQKVEADTLVWVRVEVNQPNTSRKLNSGVDKNLQGCGSSWKRYCMRIDQCLYWTGDSEGRRKGKTVQWVG